MNYTVGNVLSLYETGLSLLFEGLEDWLSDWYWIINKMKSGFNNNCMYINACKKDIKRADCVPFIKTLKPYLNRNVLFPWRSCALFEF